jgi:hypothetical protein
MLTKAGKNSKRVLAGLTAEEDTFAILLSAVTAGHVGIPLRLFCIQQGEIRRVYDAEANP